jgi:hypothetical protein
MSEISIKQYQNEVEKIIHFGGTKKETAIRTPYCRRNAEVARLTKRAFYLKILSI